MPLRSEQAEKAVPRLHPPLRVAAYESADSICRAGREGTRGHTYTHRKATQLHYACSCSMLRTQPGRGAPKAVPTQTQKLKRAVCILH